MRKHSSLEGHEAFNWNEMMDVHETDALVADEIEAEIDQSMERLPDDPQSSGAVTIRRRY